MKKMPRDPRLNGRFQDYLLESMAEGVFTLDVDGRITSWNPAMERISGYAAEEAVGQTCKLLDFSRCFDKKCPKNVRQCGVFKKGSVDPAECELMHKDGRYVPVIKNARALKDDDGNAIGVVETVTDLTELEQARRKVAEAYRELGKMHRFENIVGKSHAMRESVFEPIRMAAASDATVLIQGDSGTGKELVAGAIHYNSQRKRGPFVAVNCGALSESLLESELFGHVKGAYTGAHRDRAGRFEEADRGTLFLDEIGDISPFIQLKLLRAIQERQIERVGESKKRNIDIRIIAATHKDLYANVQEGLFREDLYYRLKVFPIHIPPLRKRKEDIPLLCAHFVDLFNRKTGKKIRGLRSDAIRILMDYSWPGNVREFENAIEHAFVVCSGNQIDVADLPIEIRRAGGWLSPLECEREKTTASAPASKREKVSKPRLMELLEACDWNKAEVARRLGKSRTAVWQYMKKWNVPLRRPEDGKGR